MKDEKQNPNKPMTSGEMIEEMDRTTPKTPSTDYVVDGEKITAVVPMPEAPKKDPRDAHFQNAVGKPPVVVKPAPPIEEDTSWEPDDTVVGPDAEEDVTTGEEEPLREVTLPLMMNRKNDKVVIGTAIIRKFENRTEIYGVVAGSTEADQAGDLFVSNIVGGFTIGAAMTPEASAKLADHLSTTGQ